MNDILSVSLRTGMLYRCRVKVNTRGIRVSGQLSQAAQRCPLTLTLLNVSRQQDLIRNLSDGPFWPICTHHPTCPPEC